MNLDAAMRLAIEQAELIKGSTYPNPPVGAVILDRDGGIAGVGATEPPGGPHAEVVALRRAGKRAVGGTARRHPGAVQPSRPDPAVRGCPCRRGYFDELCYAVADPNPEAAGGAARLAESGVRSRPGCWPTRSPGGRCASGCTSSAPGCRMSHGNSPPVSTVAARRPTAAASGSPARPPVPTCIAAARLRCDRRRHRNGLRRRPDTDGEAARRQPRRSAAAARRGGGARNIL